MDGNTVFELRPARFSERLVAYLFDTIPFAIGAAATVWVWGVALMRPLGPLAPTLIGAAWLALAVLWQVLGNLGGATPGKRLLGLRVVTVSGEPLGLGRAVARALGWVLSTPLANFGFLIALVHPRTRTLHDLLAGTYVVESGPRRSNGALAFLLAAAACVGLLVGQYWANLLRPQPDDMAAVQRARDGLFVIAMIEEAYKAQHGTYTDSLDELAEASGDAATFRSALQDVFRPRPFRIKAGNRGWRVTVAAKDRFGTLVTRSGGL